MKNNQLTLAAKYRPQGWDSLTEQDDIKIILQNQIKTGNLKHAYLFCGGAGTGKTTSCRIIANEINEGKGSPIEIDCASHNGVEDMRNIQEQCQTKPLDGSKYKVFILDEVHMLTVQAWNSMLKILEEPPEYVIFLFATTDPQKIIGTIMSRVQRFNFKRISTQGIANRLKWIIQQENNENTNDLLNNNNCIQYEEQAIQYIARLCRGGMRDAITTLEKCLDYSKNLTLDVVLKVTSGGVSEQSMLHLLQLILNKQPKEALLYFNDIYMSGIDITLFLRMYIEFIENCVKYIITSTPDIVTITDTTINWLESNRNYFNELREQLYKLLLIRNNYSTQDLKIILESWIIQRCS